jgi:prolipoprotein diacylglyceryl transferase
LHQILTSLPSPESPYLEIGGFQLRYYALLILTGIIVAVWLGSVRLKKRGVDAGVAIDVAIWAVPLGIVGARAFHVLTHLGDYFGKPGVDPISVFYIWEGGIAIYGGLIGGVFGAWLAGRASGVRFLALADAFAPGLILAQAIGRWGNYFNQELFGLPTDLPWGLEIGITNPAYPAGLPEGVLFHPTFLYESLWNLLGVFVILFLEKKFRLQWGRVFAVYLIYYGVGRSFTESLRIDPSEIILGLRTNVWSAIIGILIGLALFWWSTRKYPGIETSPFIPGREPKLDEEIPPKKVTKKSSSEDLEAESTEVNSDVSKVRKKAK